LDDIALARNWRCVCGNVLNLCVAKECTPGKALTCAISKVKLDKNSLVWHCYRGKCEHHWQGWNADLLTAIGGHQSRVKGKVYDCEKFTAIANAKLRIRSPQESRQFRTIECSKNGGFDVMANPGRLELLVEKTGYDIGQSSRVLSDEPAEVGIYLSKKCRPDQIRVVLTWQVFKKALTSITWSRRFSVDAKIKRAKSDGCTVELKNKAKFGPETTTISRLSDTPVTEIHYLVRQSIDLREPLAATMGRAVVYRHDHEPLIFEIPRAVNLPRNCGGYYWHVFTIKLVPVFQIRRVNEFYPSWPQHLQ